MGKRLRWVLLGLAVAGVPGYYALFRHSPAPEAPYALDLARVRAVAGTLPGPGPSAVRYEHVMTLKFFDAMTIAGGSFAISPMPVYAFQLDWPDRTVIVDTALPRELAKPEFLAMFFDAAALGRLQSAMERASQIVITHEHMDHIGGIATHPRLAQLLPALRLTAEQLGNPRGMEPARLPAAVMQGYAPLQYDGLHALAPGVVLLKAPGHTPGSQMVYVRRADGRELLLLGDVSWKRRNVDAVRERPLFMTLLIGEDRGQVIAQFQALHDLAAVEPALALVPGHDGPELDRIAAAGFLEQGFRLP